MHTILASPDILTNIFANLAPADLARALRVCRLWNEWSDVLWSTLPTLAPLLHLIFPFVFTGENEKYIQSVPLYQLDRTRLAQLSHFIQHLDGSSTSSKTFFDGFNPNITGFLLDLCEHGSFLFPRLRTLSTQCKNDSELLGVLPLLCPSLRSLQISIHHSAIDYMHELLGAIDKNACRLERLDIFCQPQLNKPISATPTTESHIHRELDSYIYIPPITSTLSALSSTLRVLSIPASCVSIDTLFGLAVLPQLESLAFTGSWCSDAHGDEWPEFDLMSFASLKLLALPCSVGPASRFLSSIPEAAPLQTIKIAYPDTPADQSISELCTSISRFQISLQHLSITPSPPNLAPTDQTLTNWSEFNTLLVCVRLESLVLSLPIKLAEADTAGIVRAFPQLRALSLLAEVSFSGLAQLGRLRNLAEVEVRTSAFGGGLPLLDVHSLKNTVHEGAAPTSLMTELDLNLGPSLIGSREGLVQALKGVFLHRIVTVQWSASSVIHSVRLV